MTSAIEAARAWRDQDPDPVTRAELDELIAAAEAGSAHALESRFAGRLEFGTAGLRGELGAGPLRMNRVLVAQAAAGLAAFLVGREPSPSIVIGFDGRTNSDVFAHDTARIMAGAGVRAIVLPRRLPTPVLAFAVRHLGASAGVMVTASHNPARDNGYKVYLGGADDGTQIVAPSDALIAAEITRVATGSIVDLPRSDDFETADESVVGEYIARTAALATATDVSFVYSAMHGVGWETASAVFAAAGFPAPALVTEQAEPDATFPTVAFPNPEEPGAMDLTIALCEKVGADVAIVNDPDADRLAVAIPTVDGWRRLSGNEVGSLLGWRAAERAGVDGVLGASIVSSPALSAVAAHYDLEYRDTLTGFKWISRVPGLSYGYEEALGYLVDPDKVRDKDGISAGVDFLSLAAELKAAGSSVEQHLKDFAGTFGAFASRQVSIRVDDLSDIQRMMSSLRASLPSSVGGVEVDRVDDFIEGFGEYPAGDILRFHFVGGSRVIVRPSGTEPKLKFYVDAKNDEGTVAERIAAAESEADALAAGMQALLH